MKEVFICLFVFCLKLTDATRGNQRGTTSAPTRNNCMFKSSELTDNSPLFINPTLSSRHDLFSFWNPITNDGSVVVPKNAKILFSCPGSAESENHFMSSAGRSSRNNDLLMECLSGNMWKDSARDTHQFRDLKCVKTPVFKYIVTERICGRERSGSLPYNLVKVVFIAGGTTYDVYEVCFDTANANAVYSHSKIDQSIKGMQLGADRVNFKQGPGFPPEIVGQSVDELYGLTLQKNRISALIGPAKMAEYYSRINQIQLTRGHLSPRSDFVYVSQQTSTFILTNAAPQWNTFNSGSWQQLETAIRNKMSTYGNRVDIYTGIHGQLKLKNSANVDVPISLYNTGGKDYIKVPLIYWKIMYDPLTQLGIAFLGLNNPFLNNAPHFFGMCDNICDKISHWLPANTDNRAWGTNQGFGYGICCNLKDGSLFRQIPEMPLLTVQGIFEANSPYPITTTTRRPRNN